jgi:ketosteroid isomerase-like protein
MTRTPEEVFAHHAQALGAGDLDEIVADYADDAVFITSSGIMRGKEGVRQRSPSCSVICRTHPGH